MAKNKHDDWFKGSTVSCHESHNQIKIGGGTLLGASCNHPREGYDVYVGFDYGMRITPPPAPWNPDQTPLAIVQAKFLITDHSVPANKEEFDRMIAYLIEQLSLGRRVHLGCIGGHGRTGLVMAVLVKLILGEEDAITWVRENHCKKAVESDQQTAWLHQNYGIKKVAGSKSWRSHSYNNLSASEVSTKYTGADSLGITIKPGTYINPITGSCIFDPTSCV